MSSLKGFSDSESRSVLFHHTISQLKVIDVAELCSEKGFASNDMV